MRVCILDGAEIRDKGQIHDILMASLEFPQWYGRNLDALYDCLTDIREDTEIRILHRDALHDGLKAYAAVLEKVLHEAMEVNPKVKLVDSSERT